jgi:hypothetical protein
MNTKNLLVQRIGLMVIVLALGACASTQFATAPGTPKVAARCPVTGKMTIADRFRDFSLPGYRMIWWQCPACRGWHVSQTGTQKRRAFSC